MPATSVAILDEAPAFREGLAAAFSDAGFGVDDRGASELLEIKVEMVVVVSTRNEAAWTALTEMARLQNLTVIALLPDLDERRWRRAIAAGADGVSEWVAPADTIVDVAEGALRGEFRIPAGILRNMLGESTPGADPEAISAEEVGWLRTLADGVSVRRLHETEHVSERVMYRRLRDLYHKLGANNRDQAVAIAAQLGLLRRDD